MNKKKEIHTTAFEVKTSFRGEYRATGMGNHWIVESNHGSGWKPCDKFGMWHHEPFVYRNEYLANQSIENIKAIKRGEK
jgi:hypothetical protein